MDDHSFDTQLNEYKLENIKRLFWPALIIYLSIGFVDASLSKEYGPLTFVTMRFFFFSPYILIYALRDKLSLRNVQIYGFIIFISTAFGVCTASYLLGGIVSDYYFGVLIVSFTHFVAIPFRTKGTILLELVIITVYFSLNTIPFEYSPELLTKQLSNYISYALIKIVVSGSFYKTVSDSFRTRELQRKLKQRESIQLIFGEMCHLLNNPLFISQATLKKVKENAGPKDTAYIDKAIHANDRIQKILEEILKVQSQKDLDLENPVTLKSILNEENFSSELRQVTQS